jgi:hypothetical protein
VRSDSSAATADKVARSVAEDPENTQELLAPGPSFTHTELFRSFNKGGDVNIVKGSPLSGIGWSCSGTTLKRGEPLLPGVQAFSGRTGVVSRDCIHLE